jgi:hypothetical protein
MCVAPDVNVSVSFSIAEEQRQARRDMRKVITSIKVLSNGMTLKHQGLSKNPFKSKWMFKAME